MAKKVVFIGAGSLGFTRGLFRDILSVPELVDTHFMFTDINEQNLDMVAQLCRKDIKENKLPAKITAMTNRKKALEGADYVINCVRVGGLEAFKLDIEMPLKYRVDQCVGDTLGPGGIMYGQRNIPVILEFCKDIKDVSSQNVLFLNYANPNAINTWVANHYGNVKTIGLCHGVMGGHWQITEVIKLLINEERKKSGKEPINIKPSDVDIICAGINHQTWYIKVIYDGKDWTDRLLEGFEKHPVFSRQEKVRIDVLKYFGYYSTESNGHLSEYLPWYRKRPEEIKNWLDESSWQNGLWINGETGGYLRVCFEGRNYFQTEFSDLIKEHSQPINSQSRGHEHGSYIIEALETGRIYRGHFNVVNNNCITNLPTDAIVEVPCYVDKNGISIPQVGNLPLGCAAICNASISVQRLAVEAGCHGDVFLLKQAMMMDPLTAAVCNTEEISQMTDEMLVLQSQWLPQYKKEIPRAKKNIFEAKQKGLYRGDNTSNGGAKLTEKDRMKSIKWADIILTNFLVSLLQEPVKNMKNMKYPGISLCKPDIEGRVSISSKGFIDIRGIHENKNGTIYLLTYYNSADTQKGYLAYGADGPIKVWVNGKEVDCQPDAINPALPAQYSREVIWNKGTNEILFALSSNNGMAYGIFAGIKYA
jgi:alpha-galactosidase